MFISKLALPLIGNWGPKMDSAQPWMPKSVAQISGLRGPQAPCIPVVNVVGLRGQKLHMPQTFDTPC